MRPGNSWHRAICSALQNQSSTSLRHGEIQIETTFNCHEPLEREVLWYDIMCNEQLHLHQLPDKKTILKLDIAEGAEFEWTIDGHPTGLSVNCASNLIVTCCFPDALMEFTTHGSLIRDIILQSEVSCPTHAVQMSDGQFVVVSGRIRFSSGVPSGQQWIPSGQLRKQARI
jgi:hypothetical protein